MQRPILERLAEAKDAAAAAIDSGAAAAKLDAWVEVTQSLPRAGRSIVSVTTVRSRSTR